MSDPSAPLPSRRAFLRLVAVAPLAAAGCVTVGAGPAGPGRALTPPALDPLAAVRAVPLPWSAQPALVFRAVGGHGRCG